MTEGVRISDARVLKGMSALEMEIDVNLGGGDLTKGLSSIACAFESLQVVDCQ
jgi:hypothetical protein